MLNHLSQHRAFVVLLAAATVAHLLLLLIPVVRQIAPEAADTPVVNLRLQPRPAPERPAPQPLVPEPQVAPAEPMQRPAPAPVKLAELPEPDPVEPAPPVETTTRISARKILSDMQARRESDPLSNLAAVEPVVRYDFQAPVGPSLDEVLNKPSLQLPFEDTRIYLVDAYDPGISGDVQRFFHNVTVPFGFTTKNNTRVQCAWILVLAGCAWGDASLFHAHDKARKRHPE